MGCAGRRGRIVAGQLRGIGAPEGKQPVEASAGGENAGAGFFQRCLAKSRGSTPAERYQWREGVHDEIQEMIPFQGGVSIERMCQLAGARRPGVYRSVPEQ